MSIDVTNYLGPAANRRPEDDDREDDDREDDDEDSNNDEDSNSQEGNAVEDKEPTGDEEPLDEEVVVEGEPVTKSTDNAPESGCEDSADPDTRCSESGSPEQDAPAKRQSAVSDPPETNKCEPDSDLERLLSGTGPRKGWELTSETKSARTTFCLGQEARVLFDRLSGRTGKPKKELLRNVLRLNQVGWTSRPDAFAETARNLQVEATDRVSMAIAPRIRIGLNNLRDETCIDRDRLIEIGIRLAQAALKKQVRQKITPHKAVQSDLIALREDTEEVRRKLSGHPLRSGGRTAPYENRDPVERGLFRILHMLTEMRNSIEKEVESGEPMTEYQEFP
jgi:hypothetical protein